MQALLFMTVVHDLLFPLPSPLQHDGYLTHGITMQISRHMISGAAFDRLLKLFSPAFINTLGDFLS